MQTQNVSPSCAVRLDAEAWLRLSLVPGVSPGMQRKLLDAFGTPQAVLAATPAAITSVLRDPAVAALLAAGPSPALLTRSLRWLEDKGHHLVALLDESYPPLLREIHDPPAVLYAIGKVELLMAPCFAVVGSRNCTLLGSRDARAFAKALSDEGLCIVSGLAMGIDAGAHRGGLEGRGCSIAVMGTGADIFYPASNRELAAQLAVEGCIITEFPLGTPSVAENFPRRNRLISGLSRGVLVVEAAKRSGSLITARMAGDQGRDVFAIPGSIHSTHAKGCHELIRDGAKLVDCATHILEELGLVARGTEAKSVENDAGHPHPLLDAIAFAPLTIDQIAQLTGTAAGAVCSELSVLEIDGLVESIPGGRFQRTERRVQAPRKPAPGHVIE